MEKVEEKKDALTKAADRLANAAAGESENAGRSSEEKISAEDLAKVTSQGPQKR